MANLLSNLGDLGIHHLLMGYHGVKLGGKLVDGRRQCLIGFGLGRYKLRHHVLQVGCGWLRGIGCSGLKSWWAHDILLRWDRGCVWGVGMTLSRLVVGSEVRRMLWWGLVILKGIDMFNGRWAIVAEMCAPAHHRSHR